MAAVLKRWVYTPLAEAFPGTHTLISADEVRVVSMYPYLPLPDVQRVEGWCGGWGHFRNPNLYLSLTSYLPSPQDNVKAGVGIFRDLPGLPGVRVGVKGDFIGQFKYPNRLLPSPLPPPLQALCGTRAPPPALARAMSISSLAQPSRYVPFKVPSWGSPHSLRACAAAGVVDRRPEGADGSAVGGRGKSTLTPIPHSVGVSLPSPHAVPPGRVLSRRESSSQRDERSEGL